MNYIQNVICDELARQRKLLEEAESYIRHAPEGDLIGRRRKNGYSYYQKIGSKHVNINDEADIIESLIKKKLDLKRIPILENNIKLLDDVNQKIMPVDRASLLYEQPDWCMEFINSNGSEKVFARQNMKIFDPERHIHETKSGIIVRSKNEVIIADGLFTHGISFTYEKAFPIYDQYGQFLYYRYPDFTIELSRKRAAYWEHFGLMSKIEYCNEVAKKLNDYQRNGLEFGKNLIITMDNAKGSCNALNIENVIQQQILPLWNSRMDFD